jgi:Bacterial lectin
MKPGITRFVKMAAIAALLVVAGSTAAWAQVAPCPSASTSTIAYTPDFSSSNLALNSYTSTALTGSTPTTALQLTSDTGNQTGSAWYTTAQNVEQGFSTCFQFQFTNASSPPADGIAFVIQNSQAGTSAIGYTGGNGGALGYGDADASSDPSTGAGITNSLAIEFDTYEDSWDPAGNPDVFNGSVSHVAVQSCGMGPNTSHHGQICVGTVPSSPNSTLGAPVIVPNMADGNVHTVIISYIPACPYPSCALSMASATVANIHVILDGVDLYPSGVDVDLSTIGLGPGNTAYVGFTGATGGDWETQDILNWTYTPQAQTVVLSSTPTYLNFTNANNTVVYNFGLYLTGDPPEGPTVTVQPILMTQAACDALVQKNFFPARCFVYANAEASGQDASVMFALTCPVPGETCSDVAAELSTGYTISRTDNPLFTYPGILGPLNPFPGLLKSAESTSLTPCAAPSSGPLFVSNQVNAFNDDNGLTAGRSGGGLSCWVATYNTPGEALPGITISSPSLTTYTQGQSVTASYTCSNPITSQGSSSLVGPYLTVASCTQSQAPVPSGFMNTATCSSATTPPIVCTNGTVDTSIVGLHAFWVTAIDTGGNTNVQVVAYLVVAPPKKK